MQIEIKAEKVMRWSWDSSETKVPYSIEKAAFALLNKTDFMQDPQSAIDKLEENENYESLQQIIDQEAASIFPGVKKYYKLSNLSG